MMRKLRKQVCLALLAAMLLGLCACGASPAEPTPTPTAAAPTPEPAATARPTVPGYIASEIPNPDWVKYWGDCDIYNDTFYIAAMTKDGAPAVAAFDTRTDEFTKIDITVGDLHNPVIYRMSAAADTLWLLAQETQTAEERNSGGYTEDLHEYISSV